MLSKDQKINKLILKWANDIFGTWGDIEKDLINFVKIVKEEERKNRQFESTDSSSLEHEISQYLESKSKNIAA